MAKARNNIIAALDIGSSKIVCFIGMRDFQGKVRVVGIGHQISQGIKSGVITDVNAAERSIVTAISAAEQMSGQTIDGAIINISGISIESSNLNVQANIVGHEVAESDLMHIRTEVHKNFLSSEKEIIHCIPLDYAIDDITGIKDPRKMYGNVLSTNMHMVTASSTYLKNLAHCLAICRLNIEDCIVAAHASGLACLTEDEKNLGATVIDIGGGLTQVAIFSGGNLIHAESIAIGGSHITKDLARGLSTGISYAERIKTLYGSAVLERGDREEIIDVPQAGEPGENPEAESQEIRHISKAEVISIISPRVEEIMEVTKKSLEEKGLEKILGGRIVLTGGTSQLAGIKDQAAKVFGRPARLGRPYSIDGLAEATKGAAFSTAVGTLQYAARNENSGQPSAARGRGKARGLFGKMLGWFEDNF